MCVCSVVKAAVITWLLSHLGEIYSGFAGVTQVTHAVHTGTERQMKCFLYLESLFWGKTDFYFQISNLSQLLLQLPHLPHLELWAEAPRDNYSLN